jgi:hypothetical protein
MNSSTIIAAVDARMGRTRSTRSRLGSFVRGLKMHLAGVLMHPTPTYEQLAEMVGFKDRSSARAHLLQFRERYLGDPKTAALVSDLIHALECASRMQSPSLAETSSDAPLPAVDG